MITIDINCDLGEGGLYDHKLMPLITSCSIACGGHFGNIDTMSSTVVLAKQHQVKIGAHPSYPDHQNFGRVSFKDMPIQDLKDSLLNQLQTLNDIANFHNYPLTHIKPHGALYNDANVDEPIAKLIIETVQEFNSKIPIFVAPKSIISKIGKGKIDMITEGFADRSYNADYTLKSRKLDGAVLKLKEEVLRHVLQIVKYNRVEVSKDSFIPITIETLCMHSDTENSVKLLDDLNKFLIENSIKIEPYGH